MHDDAMQFATCWQCASACLNVFTHKMHRAQVLFLLYHYFNAKEIYNAIRVFIAAYVWMTGFGALVGVAAQH